MKQKVFLLAATMLMTAAFTQHATAQNQWSQETACPGWNNPSNFLFYQGRHGVKQEHTPYNVMTGETGITWSTSTQYNYSADQLANAGLAGCTSKSVAPLPDHDKSFAIMTTTSQASGHPVNKDPNTADHLPFVPTQFNTLPGETTPGTVPTNITRSIRIGDDCATNTNYDGAALIYNTYVTTDNALMFIYYACVIQAPGHGKDCDPIFVIRVMKQDASNNWVQISDTLAYYICSTPAQWQGPTVGSSYGGYGTVTLQSNYNQNGWHTNNTTNGGAPASISSVFFKDWTKVALDLSKYMYQNVRIEIMIADCCMSYHYGYAYVAGECRPMRLLANEDISDTTNYVATLQAPQGMSSYTWSASEYGESDPVTNLQPGGVNDYFTFRELPSGDQPVYFVQPDDFRVVYRPNSNHQPIPVTDSVAYRQTFRCHMTTALDPTKPYSSDLYVNISVPPANVVVNSNDTVFGTVSGSRSYSCGDMAILCAYAKMHCRFVEWSDGATDNPRLLLVTGDTAVTAHFAPRDTVYEHYAPVVIRDTTWINDTTYINTEKKLTTQGKTPLANTAVIMHEPSSATSERKDSHPAGLFSNNDRIFIPDGLNCPDDSVITVGITVSGYPDGRLIQSPEDIISVCVNMEHSFMGDLEISLLCPSYSPEDSTGHGKAVLKYYQEPQNVTIPNGTSGGGSRYMGIPYGGAQDGSYDQMLGGNACDSIYNPYGKGFDYCFSRNGSRTLVNGEPANTPMPDSAGIANNPRETVTFGFWPIPSDFACPDSSCGEVTVITTPASNREEGTGFYVPASDFTSLVGCPVNGEWTMYIRDTWSVDNGWYFGWNIDFGTEINVLSQDTTLGTAERSGLAATAALARVTAMPKAGNYFMGWSDGSEQNPYNLMVIGDTTVVAYFAERDSLVICDTVDTLYIHDTLYLGIGMVDLPNAKIYQHNGEIVVEGAEGNTVTLYDAIGRLLATKRDDATVLHFDVPSPGTYLVRIGAHPARKIVVVR